MQEAPAAAKKIAAQERHARRISTIDWLTELAGVRHSVVYFAHTGLRIRGIQPVKYRTLPFAEGSDFR